MFSYYSNAMYLRGDFRRGEMLYEKGHRFALQTKDITALGMLESQHGLIVILYKGDGHYGVRLLEDGIRHCEEAQFVVVLGHAWMGMGYGYYFLGQIDTARELIEKGLNIQHDLGVRELVSIYYCALSAVHLSSGDLERAQSCAEEALKLSLQNNEKWPEGFSRVALGRALGKRDTSKYAKAEEYILAGIKILEEVKGKPIVAQAQFYLGELYADAGQTKKALASLKKAEGMCQEMGMDYWLRKTQPLLQKLETSVS
jgi:tetratricopeptide (TPR) repeat protein